MFMLFSSIGQASRLENVFYVGTLNERSELSPSRPTHVLVVGTARGNESDQYFQSAVLKGLIYLDRYPSHQVIIISNPDVINGTNREVFNRFNVSIIATERARLETSHLVRIMTQFQTIMSFDYFGHSSPWSLNLSGSGRLDPVRDAQQLITLRSHFHEYAFVNLNGCNGGFQIAPALSRVWQVAVSGALTGTFFERLQADGKWYKKIDRTSSERVHFNRFTFDNSRSCLDGVCWRMKPQRHSYASYWGNFISGGGLSFNKFFCNYDDNRSNCLQSMAKSIISHASAYNFGPKPSWEEYQTLVFDYLCSTARDPNYFDRCVEGILSAYNSGSDEFQMHPGNALDCNFSGCNARVSCERDRNGNPTGGSCELLAPRNQNPRSLVREYRAYKLGYGLLFED